LPWLDETVSAFDEPDCALHETAATKIDETTAMVMLLLMKERKLCDVRIDLCMFYSNKNFIYQSALLPIKLSLCHLFHPASSGALVRSYRLSSFSKLTTIINGSFIARIKNWP
jgi:hypothetical protein